MGDFDAVSQRWVYPFIFVLFYCPYTLAMRCDKNNPFIIYLLNITTMMLSANGEIILPLFIKQQNLFIEYQNLFI